MARATAITITDGRLRSHFEETAEDWMHLAVKALAQEVLEADTLRRAALSS